ncbi:hypothetical protein Cgig2_020782 [Carnegiea gigantea]|uniref:Uncharacterized protein n=1 Tax=Carnegiea gigantea TaxID=171969 RepID=A0A9Q1JGZ3_9CARY|nr:hypothetical protein Cgig2_020782 [Carnegiea gigantea]
MEPSNSSDSEENDPNYEYEEDLENEQIEVKEKVVIRQPVKAAQKRNKPSLQSKGNSADLVLVKATSSSKELQIVQEERALNLKKGATQAKAVRSMGFTSFVKVNLKQIIGKFSKWLVESFDPYAFSATTFDVYVTLGVPFGGRKIIKITKSSMDKEYDEVHAAWLKECKV